MKRHVSGPYMMSAIVLSSPSFLAQCLVVFLPTEYLVSELTTIFRATESLSRRQGVGAERALNEELAAFLS